MNDNSSNLKSLDGWVAMVVDDEFDSREVAKIMMEDAGAHVITATNGAEALEMIEQEKPHFILSDLSMPVMDGWRLMTELNKNRATESIPVIALTAHAMVGDRERAIAAGFHNYITKPLDPDKFLDSLLTILDAIPGLHNPNKSNGAAINSSDRSSNGQTYIADPNFARHADLSDNNH